VPEVRAEIVPAWAFRLPRGSLDGLARMRGGVLHRLVPGLEGELAHVRAAQTAPQSVVVGAEARTRASASAALARMRFALGVDDDLRPFHERFRHDPLIGRALRSRHSYRVIRQPDPFVALAWTIAEQKIEFTRAVEIQRRIVFGLGRRCPQSGLWAPPDAATVARTSPAFFQSLELGAPRARPLVHAAREVAAGRIDLDPAGDHERAWRRLLALPGIGPWTVEMTALTGQGRYDQVPAGDLGLLKLVGRLRGGNPRVRATEDEVRAFFAPYAPWAGLAALVLSGKTDLKSRLPRTQGARWAPPVGDRGHRQARI
jgi:3-methyladenine DNA glycosylase/8-oxoguanine DNA glycosylase